MTTDILMLSSSLRSHHCHQPTRPRQPGHPQLGTSNLASKPIWARWLAPSRSASPYQPRPAQPADPIGLEHSIQPTQVTPPSYNHCKDAEVITMVCYDFCKLAVVITMACDDHCRLAVMLGRRSNPWYMQCQLLCGPSTRMLGRRSSEPWTEVAVARPILLT